MTPANAVALFSAMFILALLPGPSVFAVVARALASGLGHAVVTILGLLAGDIIFILIAVYGVWSAGQFIEDVFIVVKYLGAAYLIILGISFWRASTGPQKIESGLGRSSVSSFISGLLITLSDPKAILFYISFLPAFLDMSQLHWLDTLSIIIIAALALCSAKLGYAYLADRARVLITNPVIQRKMNYLAGLVMIATAVFLLTRT